MAAIMNYHKLGGFKQHTFILLKFWRPEVQNESYEAKVKGQKGWFLLKGRICSLSLLGSGSHQHSLACGCITSVSTLWSHRLLLFRV